MPRRRPAEEEDEEDEPLAEPSREESSARPEGLPRGGRHRPKSRSRGGVRAWDDGSGPADEDASDDPERTEEPPSRWRKGGKEPVYFRARDSIWFEPLVSLMVIVLLLVSLYAYTSNWPPMYVVESESMQHGYDDQVGLINTGDLILAQKVPAGNVVPYVVGMQTGYTTYGEYGDVLLYHPGGDTGVAPIIHRVLIYLNYNAADDTFSAPALAGLPCGHIPNAVYTIAGTSSGCETSGLGANNTIVLHHVGWMSAEVQIPADSSILGDHSGFITMGDNNFASGNDRQGVPDQVTSLSDLVESGWMVGVARGMVPWFGSIKLALDGHAGEVPPQSWQYLGITLVGLFFAALGLHLFLRSRGIEDERRKAEEEEAEETEGKGEGRRGRLPPKSRRWSFLSSRVRRGRGRDAEEGSDDGSSSSMRPRTGGSRGRPIPRVGRRHPRSDEDEASED